MRLRKISAFVVLLSIAVLSLRGTNYLARPASGAPTAPTWSSTYTTNFAIGDATILTNSFTFSSSANRIFLLAVVHDDSASHAPAVPTVAGNNMTLVTNIEGSASSQDLDVYYYLNPAAGATEIRIAHDNTVGTVMQREYYNVNQTTPFDTPGKASGSGTSLSQNITSAANDLVVDFIGVNDGTTTLTVGGGQTERPPNYGVGGSGGARAGGSEEAGAATVTMSWSWTGTQRSSQVAVNLNAP
jgi:hypothetical protein